MGIFKKTIAERLAKDAKRLGICQEWHDELLTLDDKHAMVDMYLRGIDFCLSNDYPSNDFIRKHCGEFNGIMQSHGVFLDDGIDVVNFRKVVALGASHGVAKFNEYAVGEVYAKHDSEINVYANGHSFVMIDVFDNAIVHVYADDDAKVCVNHYGGQFINYANSANSMVKVREMHKSTY